MMKKFILPVLIIFTGLFACSPGHVHEHEKESKDLGSLSFTRYSDKTELFAEFSPLIIGKESNFASHFTVLGENFTPLAEGNITLTLDVNGIKVTVTATQPQVPGIFSLRLTPNTVGLGRLIFDIKTKNYTDQIIIDQVKVYPDEKAAMADKKSEGNGGEITFLKEQAWKVEFANTPIKKQPFSNTIKTNGQILSAPGDELMITANAKGIVLFAGKKTIAGSSVTEGTPLFVITGGNLAGENIDVTFREAKVNYEKAKSDFERAGKLVEDKIVSEKDFLQLKADYENKQTVYNSLAKNYSSKGQSVSSTMNGFLKSILVSEGQFVEAGTPLALISKNIKLVLQANVSQKYFEILSTITSANFRTTENEKVYSTEQLNGKVISYGKSASANSPFIPLSFEIDNSENLIPGSVVEVYLKSFPIPDALTVPVSALIEEQGTFFVYVQTEGESFQKREVKTGAGDGMHVQLISGVQEGERIVIKGAYQIKLSAASGTLPAHGHEH